MPQHAVSLLDKFAQTSGRIYLSGIQALVRLPLVQRQRDLAAGLNTAGFISGYRGSPVGTLDQELWQAGRILDEHHIHFQPAINEDLGATAVWGTQQVTIFEGARYDGIFGMWYGKGPGVDRSGDAFKHANSAGTSRFGGVLAIAGDDHAARSSTLAHQSEFAFMDAMIPVLNPSGVQDLLEFGILGWAMSRFSGCWVAMKAITELMDSSASVAADPHTLTVMMPDGVELPADGLNLRWPDTPLEQEHRLQKYKLYAALAFAEANRIDRQIIDSPQPRLGIVTTGKSYLDVRQALEDLGIDDDLAATIGLRLYKVGMSWPLEREGVRQFAEGLDEVLVVEEKRAVIENQLKEQLYNWRADVRPRVIGKFDESEEWVLPSTGELTPARIARVIAARIQRFYTSERITERLAFLEEKEQALEHPMANVTRLPHFCSGCPHNSSTTVPEGSRAMAGIGCHYMVTWMDRETATFTQMGGEGATWIGQAPFTETQHVFQNIGDGTYVHSGLLAIRAAVAAGVNITYKLLYNDAVAMTGGQPLDGTPSVAQITHQVYGEGVRRIAVVSDKPDKYRDRGAFARGVSFHERHGMDRLQRELRDCPGVSLLIYDQTCAAELRRRRKRGLADDPQQRVFINDLVCEGCGDCSAVSNCLSVIPVDTEFGRKRAINQSACNKDFSCLDGFCPSFVTVHGAGLPQPELRMPDVERLPEPEQPVLTDTYSILITGIGGTGIVTVGALIGMAAHIEGKGCAVLDQTGLAQKFGAVFSHVRIAPDPERIRSVRIPAGGANLLLACDIVVGSGGDALAKLSRNSSQAVVNTYLDMPSDFIRDRDYELPGCAMRDSIQAAARDQSAFFVDATRLATRLLGDSIATNLFMVGYAWQMGLIPLSRESIFTAIELNKTAVEMNKQAFTWGRWAAFDPVAVDAVAGFSREPEPVADDLNTIVARRVEFLTGYQNENYAARYRALVENVRDAESTVAGETSTRLSEAVAHYYFKLLAYKDEYEVARLYTDGVFRRKLEEQFSGNYRLRFHLAPPLISRKDPDTGRLQKREFGSWMLGAFRLMAPLRFLRGTIFDPFGYSKERRGERGLIGDYESTLASVLTDLRPDTLDLAIQLASLPEQIRGFGHVKAESMSRAETRHSELMNEFSKRTQKQTADRPKATAA